MTSTRAKAHNKRYLSGPILHRDMAPFYSAIDICGFLHIMAFRLFIQRAIPY
jgi:hypothetical protein